MVSPDGNGDIGVCGFVGICGGDRAGDRGGFGMSGLAEVLGAIDSALEDESGGFGEDRF